MVSNRRSASSSARGFLVGHLDLVVEPLDDRERLALADNPALDEAGSQLGDPAGHQWLQLDDAAGDNSAELEDRGPDVDIPRLDHGDRERPFLGGRGRRLGAGRAQVEKAHARGREQQRRQDEPGESFHGRLPRRCDGERIRVAGAYPIPATPGGRRANI